MKTPIDGIDNYLNLAALNALKIKAQHHPDEQTLKTVAEEFDALFLNTLLKEMRASTKALGEGMLDSNALNNYQSMYDQQLSVNLSKTGVGLTDLILKQINNQQVLKSSPKSPDTHSKDLI